MGRQDFAILDIGDKTALALMETHENLVLLGDPPHPQPRPEPVTPVGPVQRRQHALGLDAGDVG